MSNFAIQCNGASLPTNTRSYVVIKNSGAILGGLTNVSIAFWFKTSFNSSTSGGSIYGESAGSGNDIWRIEILSGGNVGQISFSYRDDAGTYNPFNTSATYNDNLPHFCVVTKSGTSINVYVDDMNTAAASGTLTATNNFTDAGIECWIGGLKADITDNYIGITDGLLLYNIALNATQRSTLKLGNSVTSGLLDSYPMDEGTGTTTADTTGSNNGTLTGDILPTWVAGLTPVLGLPSVTYGGSFPNTHFVSKYTIQGY